MKKTELQHAIAALLFKHPDGFTNAEIARAIDVEPTLTFNQLKVMIETNAVEKIDKTYVISDFGISTYGLIEKGALEQNPENLADHFDRVFESIEPEPAPHIPIAYKTAEEINTFQNGTVVDVGQHYRYEYKGIKIDPFRIAQIYNIQDFALQTALKKILCAGNRGFKDLRQDLLDVRCAIDRKLEMMMEDAV